eukprot:gene1781-4891_t
MPVCQHRGCGKEFSFENNNEGGCQFHPGCPIFHEGLKGWTCCNKRFTDFTEFLEYPGCTFGKHTDEPPEDDVKTNDIVKELSATPIDRLSLEQQQSATKLRDGTPKVDLERKVTASLERALEQFHARQAEKGNNEVKPGQPCTNNACSTRYVDESSNDETCFYHPGAPVFHECYKYWSCCPTKKTYEFDEFLDFKGCSTGKHCWVKPKTTKIQQCRYDWFQSNDSVSLSIFAKCVDPSQCDIKANSDSVSISIVYEDTNKFSLELHLAGKIDPSKSKVVLTGTKLDITMVKAVPEPWPALEASSSATAATKVEAGAM